MIGLTACNASKAKETSAQIEAVKGINEEANGETQNKNSIIAWGEVGYTDSEEINIDFPCLVSSVEVKEGQVIKKGDILITLDMNEYKQNIQKLQKQVSLNEVVSKDITQDSSALAADILQLKKDIATKAKAYSEGTKADLQILKNNLTRMNKEISDAKKDYEKQKQLFAVGGIPQKILDDYADLIDKKEKAKIDIENNMIKTKDLLEDELDALRTSLEYKQVQLEKMQTSNAVNTDKQSINISAAQLDLNIMKTKLAKTYLLENKIVSNIEKGIVKNISVINGSALGKQNISQKVLEIIDADTIVVRAEVPEEFVLNIKENDTVQIVPKADTTQKIIGKVTQISAIAIEKDGERIVKVEIKPDDQKGILKAGYSADVMFGTN